MLLLKITINYIFDKLINLRLKIINLYLDNVYLFINIRINKNFE